MRLRKMKHVDERLEKNKDKIITSYTDLAGKWQNYFQNDNQIYLEIGMGKGKFISSLARSNPNINYIGIEKEKSVIIQAADRLGDKLANLIFVNMDATNLTEAFNANEVDKLYLNFSDPWPKARHAKRRLTSPNNLAKYRYILKVPCIIEMKTDNKNLFEYSVETLKNNRFYIDEINYDLHNLQNSQNDKKDIVTTEYEDRFVKENKKIYFLVASIK